VNARRWLFVHAGVVEWRGAAIVIPGSSWSGKSSLVAALVRAGATYYSDEYAVLDSSGRVYPFARPLGIRGSSFRADRVSVERFGGRAGRDAVPIGLVVATRYRAGGKWRPRVLSPGQTMVALLENTLLTRARSRRVLGILRQV